jgi:hypothetical protein
LRALVQRHAELLVGVQQFLRHFVERGVLRLRRRVVADRLEIDRRDVELRPVRHRHRQPVAIRGQAPLRHPLRLFLLGGEEADDVLDRPGGSASDSMSVTKPAS